MSNAERNEEGREYFILINEKNIFLVFAPSDQFLVD